VPGVQYKTIVGVTRRLPFGLVQRVTRVRRGSRG
jgi:hypothetical protein